MTPVTIVLMTRDRVDELEHTLARLLALPERPAVMVVDNGSSDGTAERVRHRFPRVELLGAGRNLGVRARNLAAQRAATPYVAFCDDDSWWAPGTLRRAVELFERFPTLGALTAHVLVEPGGRDDPTSLEMRDSPLARASAPGIPVLGFLACATVVRRRAFLGVGGFEERFHFGGEEQLLAADLAAAGWEIRYVPELVVHHRASTRRDPAWRGRRDVRNTLWFLWLRRPPATAARRSRALLRASDRPTARAGCLAALRGLPWVLRRRCPLPGPVERALVRIETGGGA